MIDLIIEETKAHKIQYVGFSNGTTQAFYGFSKMAEWYEDHVAHAIMLSPCTKASGVQRESFA